MTGVGTLALSLMMVGEGRAQGWRFDFEAWRCADTLQSAWRGDDGRLVAAEKLDFEGERWVRYRMQRLPVAQDVVAVREGNMVGITIRNGDSSRQVMLRAAADLQAGPTLVSHLAGMASRLPLRQSIEFDYLIAEQGMVLRLRAAAIARAADGSTTLKLEAASMLLRAVVPSTTLRIDARGALTELSGRLLPQVGDVTKPKSLDGVLRIRSGETISGAARMQSVCNKPRLS